MPIHKILVATDFTEASDAAIESALELASSLGASVTLAHTYEMPTYGIGDPNLVMPLVEVAADVDRTLDQTMKNEVESRRDRGVPLAHVVRMGPAPDAINAVAEEIGADLIIVGTHGRTGLAHALLGSTAESIVRGATRAVMIVRSGAPPLEHEAHGAGPVHAA
jgi:nucleotide-binding universal stress UspA family protein